MEIWCDFSIVEMTKYSKIFTALNIYYARILTNPKKFPSNFTNTYLAELFITQN